MFGYSEDKAIGCELHRLLAPERFHQAYMKSFKNFQLTGEGAAIGKTLELTALHKDGHEFPIDISLSAIQIGEEWHAVGIVRDITERKRAEEHTLRQTAVLKAINKVFQETLNCETAEEVAYTCINMAEELTGSEYGLIGEVNEAGRFDTLSYGDLGWAICKNARIRRHCTE